MIFDIHMRWVRYSRPQPGPKIHWCASSPLSSLSLAELHRHCRLPYGSGGAWPSPRSSTLTWWISLSYLHHTLLITFPTLPPHLPSLSGQHSPPTIFLSPPNSGKPTKDKTPNLNPNLARVGEEDHVPFLGLAKEFEGEEAFHSSDI